MTWRVTDRRWLVTKTPEERQYDKRRYDNAHRSAHADHYRALERERARRYRERKKSLDQSDRGSYGLRASFKP